MLHLTRDSVTPRFGQSYSIFAGEGEPEFIDGQYHATDTAAFVGSVAPRVLANLGVFLDPGESVEMYLDTTDIVRLAFADDMAAVA